MSSPTIMTADEIAAARSRLSQCVTLIEEGNLEDRDIAKMVDDAARVLRSHDALIPPAAPDGEALGRAAWRARATPGGWGRWTDAEVAACMDESWETQSPEERARYQRIGLALHAIGYAAGRSGGEAERARLADALECMRVERDHFCAEKDRIYREEAQVNAEIARLQVERDTAHDEYISATERADIAEARVGNLEAELAEARAAVERANENEAIAREMMTKCAESERATLAGWARAKEEAEDAARRDGAQEERKAIVERVRRLAAEGAPGMPEDGDETLVDWIATEIEDRARGEEQGS